MGCRPNYKMKRDTGGCARGGKGIQKNRNFRGDFKKVTNFHQVIPDRVIPFGYFSYKCENDIVCKVEIADVPYFNASVYLENKEAIGKVDEIFGKLRDYSVTIKLSPHITNNSFSLHQKLFIDPSKLLPINKFLPKSHQPKSKNRKQSNKSNYHEAGSNLWRYRNDASKINKFGGNNIRKFNCRNNGGRTRGMKQHRSRW